MHLELWLRGEKRCVDRFIQDLSAKYMEFTFRKSDGKGGFLQDQFEKYHWPISVRIAPFGIYEIVFPKEHRDLVLTTILGKKEEVKRSKLWNSWKNKYVEVFRKLLKLKKIPDYDDSKNMPLFRDGIEFIPIGIKEDQIVDGVEYL